MVHERSQARRIALQGMYQLDVQGDDFLVGGAGAAGGLQGFIDQATEDPSLGFLGEKAVNVLRLNLLLDEATAG